MSGNGAQILSGPPINDEFLGITSVQGSHLLPDSVPVGDWLVWQLADSAFPTGGFGHSGGLEAAVQHGLVADDVDLRAFAVQALRQAVHAAAPFMLGAFDEPAGSSQLDLLLDATLSNHVANRSSRAQGQTLVSTAARVFTESGLPEWRQKALAGGSPMHLPIVFGVVMRRLSMSRQGAARLYLFITLRGILSAAVRLGIVGPLRAQQVQAELAGELEALSGQAQTLTIRDFAQISPLTELLQSAHDRLYSRLFQS